MANEEHARLQRAAGIASITVALALVVAKVWAWQATDSVSLLSSLVDSILDTFASALTLFAIFFSLRPADREHRFGHGKAEGLAALAQAVIITLSAIYVFIEALGRLLEPEIVRAPKTGIAVMLLSIALTLILVFFQRHVIRETGSLAISADAVHYKSDLLINLGVLIVIPIAAYTPFYIVDPLIGIAIAVYILSATMNIAAKALDVLLDRELPDEDRARIRKIATNNEQVLGFHDLRTRSGGNKVFIQFHLEMAPQTTLSRAHRVMDEVEDRVRKAFPGCDIIVHADPEGHDEHRDSF